MSVHHSVRFAGGTHTTSQRKAQDTTRSRPQDPDRPAPLDLGHLCERLDRKSQPTGTPLFVGRQGAIGFLDQERDDAEPSGGGAQGVFRPAIDRFASGLLETVRRVKDQHNRLPNVQRSGELVKAADLLTLLARRGEVVDTAEFRQAIRTLKRLRDDTALKALPPGYVVIDLSTVDEEPTRQRTAGTPGTHDNLFESLRQESARIGAATSSIIAHRKRMLKALGTSVVFGTNLSDDKARALELNSAVRPSQSVQAMATREGQDPRDFLKCLLLDSAVSAYLTEPVFTALVHLYTSELSTRL